MTYQDENQPHNTTVVFVPAGNPKPQRRPLGGLLPLLLLIPLLAVALILWLQPSFLTAGGSGSNSGDQQSGNAGVAVLQEQEGILAIVGTEGASLYDAPNGFEVADFSAGEELTAVGRTEDNGWVSVEAKNGQAGWTATESVVLIGVDRLPVTGEAISGNSDDGDSGNADGEDSTVAIAATSTPFVVETSVAAETPTVSPADEESIADGDSGEESMADDDSGEESMADDDSGEESMADNDAGEESMADDDSGEESMADNDAGEESMTSDDSGEESMADNDADPTVMSVPTLPPTATTEAAITAAPTATVEPTATAEPTPAPTSEPEGAPSGDDGNDATDDSGEDSAETEDTDNSTMTSVDSGASVNSGASVLGVVRAGDTQLYTAPDGNALDSLKVGSSLFVSGRSEDSVWLKARTDEGIEGWVTRDDVVAFRLEELPVVDPGSPPADDSAVDESAVEESMNDVTSDSDDSPDAASEGRSEANSSNEESMTKATAGSSEASAATDGAASPGTGETSADSNNEVMVASNDANDDPNSDAVSERLPSAGNASGALAGTVSSSVSQLNVRSGPSATSSILGQVNRNDGLSVVSRSPNSQWYLVNNPLASVSQGWVSANFVDVNGSGESLPVVATSGTSGTNTSATGVDTNADVGESAETAAPAAPSAGAAPVAGLSGKLVFQGELGGPIYLYNFGNGSVAQITTGMDPNLSPDGQRVAFARQGANGGVYVINIDGTNERRLFASDQGPRSPSWSPAGDKIVFSRLTGEYRCTNLGFGLCVKNNKYLSGFNQVTKEERGLSRIDLDGENFRDLPALNTANTPDWGDAGVLYSAATSLEYTQDTDDGPNTGIVNQTIGYQDPAWQPSERTSEGTGGGRVIFQAKEGSHWEIFGINPNGSGIAALTKPVTTLVDELPSNVAPAWSPDGRFIVYVSNRDAGNSAGPWRIWVMNADGSNQRPLPIDVAVNYQFNLEQMVHWGR